MKRRRTLLSLAVAAWILAGCLIATTPVRFVSSYQDEDSAFRRALVQELRKTMLVAEDGNALIFESGPHAIPAKGVFGFGPTWQELIRFRVEIIPRPPKRSADVNEYVRLAFAGGPKVQVIVNTFERQNDGFPWQPKQGAPTNEFIEKSIIQTIQRVAATRNSL